MYPEEKFFLSMEKAKKSIQTADHLVYMTLPILKENRLLLKVLEEINLALISIINAILQYEFLYKRIQIYTDPKENFRTFQRIAPRYKINDEQLKKITEILLLAEKHKKSPFEFSKNGKIVIMSEGMAVDSITIEKVKSFLIEAKDVIRKVSIAIRQ